MTGRDLDGRLEARPHESAGMPGALSRRRVVQLGILGALALATGSRLGRAADIAEGGGRRRLRLFNTHTSERVDLCYHDGAQLVPDALAEVNRVLRDHRSDEVHPIAPAVLDIAWALATAVGRPGAEFEIISGYRSSETNAMLRAGNSGVATRSLHCAGRAIDLRLVGVDTARLRDAALALARGGVGYYRESDFVHVDDGRVRRW